MRLSSGRLFQIFFFVKNFSAGYLQFFKLMEHFQRHFSFTYMELKLKTAPFHATAIYIVIFQMEHPVRRVM